MAVNWGAFQTIGGGQGGGQKDPLMEALKLAELRKQGGQGDAMALMEMMNKNKKFNYEKGFNQFKEIHKRIGDLTSQLGDLNQELSAEDQASIAGMLELAHEDLNSWNETYKDNPDLSTYIKSNNKIIENNQKLINDPSPENAQNTTQSNTEVIQKVETGGTQTDGTQTGGTTTGGEGTDGTQTTMPKVIPETGEYEGITINQPRQKKGVNEAGWLFPGSGDELTGLQKLAYGDLKPASTTTINPSYEESQTPLMTINTETPLENIAGNLVNKEGQLVDESGIPLPPEDADMQFLQSKINQGRAINPETGELFQDPQKEQAYKGLQSFEAMRNKIAEQDYQKQYDTGKYNIDPETGELVDKSIGAFSQPPSVDLLNQGTGAQLGSPEVFGNRNPLVPDYQSGSQVGFLNGAGNSLVGGLNRDFEGEYQPGSGQYIGTKPINPLLQSGLQSTGQNIKSLEPLPDNQFMYSGNVAGDIAQDRFELSAKDKFDKEMQGVRSERKQQEIENARNIPALDFKSLDIPPPATDPFGRPVTGSTSVGEITQASPTTLDYADPSVDPTTQTSLLPENQVSYPPVDMNQTNVSAGEPSPPIPQELMDAYNQQQQQSFQNQQALEGGADPSLMNELVPNQNNQVQPPVNMNISPLQQLQQSGVSDTSFIKQDDPVKTSDFMKTTIPDEKYTDDYQKITNAETGGEKDPNIRTNVQGSGSSAFGPAQLTKGLAEGYLNKEGMNWTDEEKGYLEKFNIQGEKFLKYGGKDMEQSIINEGLVPGSPEAEAFKKKWDYGGTGELTSEKDNEMYEQVVKKMMKEIRGRVGDDDDAFRREWRFGSTGAKDKNLKDERYKTAYTGSLTGKQV